MQWETKKVKLSELKDNEKNPRKITETNLKKLKESLEKFNLVETPVINLDCTILAGHQRVKILKTYLPPDEEIDVRCPSELLSQEDADEYLLRSNISNGEFDFFSVHDNFNFNFEKLKMFGFNDFKLEQLYQKDVIEDNFDVNAELENVKTPTTKLGDIYILGEHRLMCGSATSSEDFERLMEGKKGQLVFTDPPYNVNYKSPVGLTYSSKKFGGTGGKIFNDNLSEKDYEEFLNNFLANLYNFTYDNCAFYVWYAFNKNVILNLTSIKNNNFELIQNLIWVNSTIVLSQNPYHYSYESCLLFKKKRQTVFKNNFCNNYQDVLNIDSADIFFEKTDDRKKYLYPTQKPVRLSERAIKRNSKSGDIVIDVFGGSGSTLIGCEQLGRKCYMMELDPKYCDVIVKRWEMLTGKKTTKTK